jgi:excisionase family DNA binding protein
MHTHEKRRRVVGRGAAAAHAQCHPDTIRRRIAEGKLPAYRFGVKLIRIDLADVDALFTPFASARALASPSNVSLLLSGPAMRRRGSCPVWLGHVGAGSTARQVVLGLAFPGRGHCVSGTQPYGLTRLFGLVEVADGYF